MLFYSHHVYGYDDDCVHVLPYTSPRSVSNLTIIFAVSRVIYILT